MAESSDFQIKKNHHASPATVEAHSSSSGDTDKDEIPEIVTGCRVCDAILSAYSRPLRINAFFNVGKVEDVLSGTCYNHEDFIDGYVGDWEELGLEGEDVTIFKPPGDSCLRIFVGDTLFNQAMELVQEPGITGSGYQEFLKPKALTTDPSIGFRRGKVLDKDWIESNTVSGWYQRCKSAHGTACHDSPLRNNLVGRPRYLIDVSEDCIVQADPLSEYTALSYVWGSLESCQLTRDNLSNLQTRHSLRDEVIAESIPLTIRHAMDLTRMLGVQYLWVDALCIVQDGESDLKAQELNKMGDIYQNACLTVVAADGSHADHGLHGLQEVSLPLKRSCEQHVFPLGTLGRAVFRIFPLGNEREEVHESPTIYYRRAWTFQEYLFSRRRVVFEKGSVLWECCCATWFEDIDCSASSSLRQSAVLSAELSLFQKGAPNLSKLINAVNRFNHRQLTYEEDCLPAFSGLATAMSLNFVGGFLCGLPQLFFDIALLWQPAGEMKRRRNTIREGGFQSQHTSSLPSWSWAGWAGPIDTWSWQSGNDFVKNGPIGAMTSHETIPITTWYSGDSIIPTTRQKISTQSYTFKQRFRNPNSEPPEAWTKHIIPENTFGKYPDNPPPEGFGSYYFTHGTNSQDHFWYPIPFCEGGTTPMLSAPLLFASVESAIFYTRGVRLAFHIPSVTIENHTGEWAGTLRSHCRSDISENVRPKMRPLELVAVSRGIVRNSGEEKNSLEEWHLEQRPKDGPLYEFYNVLWVSQSQGISYRRGIGRVLRAIWESRERHRVDLILG